ncbi:MAG: hypothetical protein ACI4NV_04825, partial [Thermoguttaceae bacterium]
MTQKKSIILVCTSVEIFAKFCEYRRRVKNERRRRLHVGVFKLGDIMTTPLELPTIDETTPITEILERNAL